MLTKKEHAEKMDKIDKMIKILALLGEFFKDDDIKKLIKGIENVL